MSWSWFATSPASRHDRAVPLPRLEIKSGADGSFPISPTPGPGCTPVPGLRCWPDPRRGWPSTGRPSEPQRLPPGLPAPTGTRHQLDCLPRPRVRRRRQARPRQGPDLHPRPGMDATRPDHASALSSTGGSRPGRRAILNHWPAVSSHTQPAPRIGRIKMHVGDASAIRPTYPKTTRGGSSTRTGLYRPPSQTLAWPKADPQIPNPTLAEVHAQTYPLRAAGSHQGPFDAADGEHDGQDAHRWGSARAARVHQLARPPQPGERRRPHVVPRAEHPTPRCRVAAGLGAEVARKYQEDIMEAAWQQVGDVLSMETALSRARLSPRGRASGSRRTSPQTASRSQTPPIMAPLADATILEKLTLPATIAAHLTLPGPRDRPGDAPLHRPHRSSSSPASDAAQPQDAAKKPTVRTAGTTPGGNPSQKASHDVEPDTVRASQRLAVSDQARSPHARADGHGAARRSRSARRPRRRDRDPSSPGAPSNSPRPAKFTAQPPAAAADRPAKRRPRRQHPPGRRQETFRSPARLARRPSKTPFRTSPQVISWSTLGILDILAAGLRGSTRTPDGYLLETGPSGDTSCRCPSSPGGVLAVETASGTPNVPIAQIDARLGGIRLSDLLSRLPRDTFKGLRRSGERLTNPPLVDIRPSDRPGRVNISPRTAARGASLTTGPATAVPATGSVTLPGPLPLPPPIKDPSSSTGSWAQSASSPNTLNWPSTLRRDARALRPPRGRGTLDRIDPNTTHRARLNTMIRIADNDVHRSTDQARPSPGLADRPADRPGDGLPPTSTFPPTPTWPPTTAPGSARRRRGPARVDHPARDQPEVHRRVHGRSKPRN